MLEELLIRTGLPNFHPLAVHFPIALLFTAVLFDVLCLALRRQRWLDPAATSLYVLGTIGAAAAWWTGTQASTTMWDASGAAQAAMADHESLGLLTLIAFTVVTVLRVVVARTSRRDKVTRFATLRLLALAAALAALILLVSTAHKGGELVYGHGMGVTVTEELEP